MPWSGCYVFTSERVVSVLFEQDGGCGVKVTVLPLDHTIEAHLIGSTPHHPQDSG